MIQSGFWFEVHNSFETRCNCSVQNALSDPDKIPIMRQSILEMSLQLATHGLPWSWLTSLLKANKSTQHTSWFTQPIGAKVNVFLLESKSVEKLTTRASFDVLKSLAHLRLNLAWLSMHLHSRAFVLEETVQEAENWKFSVKQLEWMQAWDPRSRFDGVRLTTPLSMKLKINAHPRQPLRQFEARIGLLKPFCLS